MRRDIVGRLRRIPRDTVRGHARALGDVLYLAGVVSGAIQWILFAEPRASVREIPWRARKHTAALLLRAGARVSGRRVGIALVYHRVAAEQGDPDQELVPAIAVDTFRQQLRHVRRWYRVVAASELPDAVASRRRGERVPIAITLDDDLLSHRTYAAPALRDAALTATFFLGSCDSPPAERYWWELLQGARDSNILISSMLPEVDEALIAKAIARIPKALRDVGRSIESLPVAVRAGVLERLRQHIQSVNPGLTRADVADLAEQGFEVGFHTVRHDPLPGLDDAQLQAALQDGRRELEHTVGRQLAVLAYPHGKADSRVARAAAGTFEFAYTGAGTAVTPASNRHLLGRLEAPLAGGAAFAYRLATAVGGT
jgi:peptidoglycan/xylan/chitin deacetylase (PgdA/CDA1 family)